MIKIGAHMAITKGFSKVPEDSFNIGANTFQIFVHSPRVWAVTPIKPNDDVQFKENLKKYCIDPQDILVHSGYLINLASPKDDMWEKSINSMINEMQLCSQLGIKYFNVHPGSHLGEGEEFGINRIAKALDAIFKKTSPDTTVLLENTAQKGGNIGYSFDQLGKIIKAVQNNSRLGITYDTCHGFDSYYDIRTKDGVRKLISEIDDSMGFDRLRMIHLNDSKFDLGAGKDRHEFIGKGFIGIEGFRTFLSFDEIRKIPLLLETPGNDADHANDIMTVKSLL